MAEHLLHDSPRTSFPRYSDAAVSRARTTVSTQSFRPSSLATTSRRFEWKSPRWSFHVSGEGSRRPSLGAPGRPRERSRRVARVSAKTPWGRSRARGQLPKLAVEGSNPYRRSLRKPERSRLSESCVGASSAPANTWVGVGWTRGKSRTFRLPPRGSRVRGALSARISRVELSGEAPCITFMGG